MSHVGIALIALAIPTLATAIALNGSNDTEDAAGPVALSGVAMLGAGLPLTIIGSQSKNQYREALDVDTRDEIEPSN